jgi:hypothetical protein
MASTGTGSRGKKPIFQSKGATITPHAKINSIIRNATIFLSRKNRMILSNNEGEVDVDDL